MRPEKFPEDVISQLDGTGLRPECIKVGQLDIHYLTGGEGEPLIVLHGGGGSGRAWLKNAAELSRYYKVYLPDLPGFGLSKAVAEDFKLSSYVAFVEDFSHSLGLGRFHLVGHSLGGGIALNYALRFPHKIKRLVLVQDYVPALLLSNHQENCGLYFQSDRVAHQKVELPAGTDNPTLSPQDEHREKHYDDKGTDHCPGEPAF